MFDVGSSELLLLGAVAIAVIPPKDLPRAMRFAGQWIGKARGMARHFRSGIDEMIRQAELDEIEKKWREENERIMREHPLEDAIEHQDGTAVAALPPPDQNEEYLPAETYPDPTAEEARSDIAPAPPALAVHDDAGPELPLGLPPKQ